MRDGKGSEPLAKGQTNKARPPPSERGSSSSSGGDVESSGHRVGEAYPARKREGKMEMEEQRPKSANKQTGAKGSKGAAKMRQKQRSSNSSAPAGKGSDKENGGHTAQDRTVERSGTTTWKRIK